MCAYCPVIPYWPAVVVRGALGLSRAARPQTHQPHIWPINPHAKGHSGKDEVQALGLPVSVDLRTGVVRHWRMSNRVALTHGQHCIGLNPAAGDCKEGGSLRRRCTLETPSRAPCTPSWQQPMRRAQRRCNHHAKGGAGSQPVSS